MNEQAKKKKIYLSLPISGYDLEERIAVASQKKAQLESMGWIVANPMENGLPVNASTHAHMKRDFEMLLECDAVLFMERWLHSKGCAVEFQVATAIGLDIYFEECFDIKSKTKFK